jgi:hypothetical protein
LYALFTSPLLATCPHPHPQSYAELTSFGCETPQVPAFSRTGMSSPCPLL